jgi:osmoprotectant transport system ATP-binding protein
MPVPGVEFAAVSYTFPAPRNTPARTLLHDINLTLAPGTTTALLGRSGSGKTTLLRMVNALVCPTSGAVLIDGRPVHQQDSRHLRRSIGYVIQETGLFPHMTIERNAALALELAGIPAPQRHQRTTEVLSLVGLISPSLDPARIDPADLNSLAQNQTDLRTRYPWQLSGGQRQRVGLARALASDPGILLMDEPFGALDPLTRAEMQTMLRTLLARVGKTVLLVTHDLDEALYLAHRIIFLDSGRIVADLPTPEVLTSPNPHIRAYINAVHRAVEAPN